tara:strand:- start:764 stop:1054 length:291 start_codon:yes stop_codon:yes gene_type:complete
MEKNFKNFPTKSTLILAKTQRYYWCIIKHEESDFDFGDGFVVVQYMKLLLFIQRISTGKVVLAFIIPAIIVYFMMLLYTIPQVSAYAPRINLFYFY